MDAATIVGLCAGFLTTTAFEDPPIILWNAVTLVLAAAILAMKVRFG